MKYSRPDGPPCHKLRIQTRVISFDNIENRIIEQRNQPRDPHNRDRLGPQNTKHHTRKRTREQRFIDTVEATCSAIHVEDERQCRQNTADDLGSCTRCTYSLIHILHEIDPHRPRKHPIPPRIRDVAPIVWQTPADVVIHAQPWAEDAVGAPCSSAARVGVNVVVGVVRGGEGNCVLTVRREY